MDKIKNLNQDEFNIIAAETGFNRNILLKDYYITIILCLLKKPKEYTSKVEQHCRKYS